MSEENVIQFPKPTQEEIEAQIFADLEIETEPSVLETETEAPSAPGGLSFPQQVIVSSTNDPVTGNYRTKIPYAYEVWKNGVFKREFAKARAWHEGSPETNLFPYPSIDRECPHGSYAINCLTEIAPRPMWIKRIGQRPDVENHTVELSEISYYHGPEFGFKDLWVETPQIHDAHSIQTLSQHRVPVRSTKATVSTDFLVECYENNLSEMPVQNVVSRTGHYTIGGKHGYLLGKEWIGPQDLNIAVDTVGQHGLQKALHSNGDAKKWVDFTRPLLEKYTIVRWLNAASFGAPLIKLVNHRNFIIHHFIATKSSKTALGELGQSAWGDPAKFKTTCSSTGTSMSEIFRHMSDLPMLYNELQALDKRKTDIANLIYVLCEGVPKNRSLKYGGLARTYGEWRFIGRFTGEDSLIGGGKNDLGGQNSRVLELRHAGVPEEVGQDIYRFMSEGHYGHAGRTFLEKLVQIANIPEALEKLKTIHIDFRKQIARDYGSRNDHTDHCALIALSEYLMLRWIYGYETERARELALADAVYVKSALSENAENNMVLWKKVAMWLKNHKTAHPGQYIDMSNASGLYELKVIAKVKEGAGGGQGIVGFESETEIWYVPTEINPLLERTFDCNPAKRIWPDLADQGIALRMKESNKTVLRLKRSYTHLGMEGDRVYVVKKDALDSAALD